MSTESSAVDSPPSNKVYTLIVTMMHINGISVNVHHFDNETTAVDELNYYKRWYITYFNIDDSEGRLIDIPEFDAMVEDGRLKALLFPDVAFNNLPFDFFFEAVDNNLNRQHHNFYDRVLPTLSTLSSTK